MSPTWSLNEVDALSDCDPQEGFEKKKADIKDSGKYECKVDGRVMRIFDVIVYGRFWAESVYPINSFKRQYNNTI